MRFSLLLLLALTGCATATEMRIADGNRQFFITCEDQTRLCIHKANEVCPEGYKLIEQPWTFHGRGSTTTMTIECPKQSAPKD